MVKLGYSYKLNIIKSDDLGKKINNKLINFININFKTKKIFDKNFIQVKKLYKKIFDMAIKLIRKKKVSGIINGPISKKHFLNKNFLELLNIYQKRPSQKIILLC